MDLPGKLIAVIGDEETVTGFILAGVGHRTTSGENFLIVKDNTEVLEIEDAFMNFTRRTDVGILLINQHVANEIRHKLRDYTQTIPTILEIPSKDTPYDPEQDTGTINPHFTVNFNLKPIFNANDTNIYNCPYI